MDLVLSESDAKRTAADLDVTFNQYGQRNDEDRREVSQPIPVESATWRAAGELTYWVGDRPEWGEESLGRTVTTSGSERLILENVWSK